MKILSAHNITKEYGATKALKGVDFDIYQGCVNVLIGENGAGKSTLMKILAGIEAQTTGDLQLNGKTISFNSAAAAIDAGISIVHQELNLCPNLSVAENIFLSNRKNKFFLDSKDENAKAKKILDTLEINIDPSTKVENLRIGQQQSVEIARALAENAKILILDEPTSALSPNEVKVLFKLINELKGKGTSIVYISHKLEELLQIGDYITILRDGEKVAFEPIANASMRWIVSNMLGRDTKKGKVYPVNQSQDKILELKEYDVGQTFGDSRKNINLEFRAGEVAAIYGLLGSGRSALLESIAGLRPIGNGKIIFGTKNIGGLSAQERIRSGICLVPKDRKNEALFDNMNIGENISIASLSKFSSRGIINSEKENLALDEIIKSFGVKTQNRGNGINSLSGGNQQKSIIARCLLASPTVLLIDEPGRGVDVGAREEIYNQLRNLALSGLTIIFSTSDISETKYADRVIVMAGGQISADLNIKEAKEQKIIEAANMLQKATAD